MNERGIYLYDLFPLVQLEEALENRYVRRQSHPTLPLSILNYTERCAYDSAWTPVTRQCRGLIYETATHRIVARPFPKFFNHGEPNAPELALDARAVVTDKMDGSLGILYATPCERCSGSGEEPFDDYQSQNWLVHVPCGDCEGSKISYAIATRGSFASEQAVHATEVLRTRYREWRPLPDASYLFEIVFPGNRVVLNYLDVDDLYLLAVLDIETGTDIGHDEATWSRLSQAAWPGPRVDSFGYATLGEALAAEPRENAEGLVVYLPDRNERVKIKYEEYVRLHRIVTGLNKRTVWAHLDAGLTIEDLIAPLPDEFRPWVEDVVAELSALVVAQAREIETIYQEIVAALDVGSANGLNGQWDRRDFANFATQSPWSWALFLRLEGRDYSKKLWHNARPDVVGPDGRIYIEESA